MAYHHLWIDILNAEYDGPARERLHRLIHGMIGRGSVGIDEMFYGRHTDFLNTLRSAWLDVKRLGPDVDVLSSVYEEAGSALTEPFQPLLGLSNAALESTTIERKLIQIAVFGFSAHVQDIRTSDTAEIVERCMGLTYKKEEKIKPGVDRRAGVNPNPPVGFERRGSEEMLKSMNNVPEGFEIWASDPLATLVLGANASPHRFRRCVKLFYGNHWGRFCSKTCMRTTEDLSRRLFDPSYYR